MIHKTTADSKGSCSKYAEYLNKENEEFIKENRPEKQQYFFNHDSNKIDTIKAINHIDHNTKGKGLKTKEDKYFTITINYSQKELKHLISKVTDKKVTHVDQLSQKEYLKYNDLIKDHVKTSMKNYAKNFGNGITQKDIKWVAKVEHYRKFKGYEKQVKKGSFKSGDKKPGLNTHCHIIVHRSHATKRIRLSPHRKAKNTTKHQLRGKKVSNSNFHKVEFIKKNEQSFDKMFQYNRSLEEKFTIQNTLKNGIYPDKKKAIEKILIRKAKILEYHLKKQIPHHSKWKEPYKALNRHRNQQYQKIIKILKDQSLSNSEKQNAIKKMKEDEKHDSFINQMVHQEHLKSLDEFEKQLEKEQLEAEKAIDEQSKKEHQTSHHLELEL